MESYDLHFIDPVTRLPHYMGVLPILQKKLRKDAALGMLFLHFEGLDRVEETHGPKIYDEIVREIAEGLRSLHGNAIRKDDLICMANIGSGSFMIFLCEKRRDKSQSLNKHDIEVIADRVQDRLFPQVFPYLFRFTKQQPRLHVGYSFVVYNPLLRSRHLIYRLIDEAKQMAQSQSPRSQIKSREKLQRIILQQEIYTVFQPIVDLKTKQIVAYEALARGPKNSLFESPLVLFSIASEVGLLVELDRLCRNIALQECRKLPKDAYIFINTLPNSVFDPEFRGVYLETILKNSERDPKKIVFEITERAAIDNFGAFREAIRYFREMGMKIAIDDVGTGYSSLEAIVELHPDFLKFDMSMVLDIGKSLVKQSMLEMLRLLAGKLNTRIIAEGIENVEDYTTIRDMGVDYGQGFFISHPRAAEDLVDQQDEVQSNVHPLLLAKKR